MTLDESLAYKHAIDALNGSFDWTRDKLPLAKVYGDGVELPPVLSVDFHNNIVSVALYPPRLAEKFTTAFPEIGGEPREYRVHFKTIRVEFGPHLVYESGMWAKPLYPGTIVNGGV